MLCGLLGSECLHVLVLRPAIWLGTCMIFVGLDSSWTSLFLLLEQTRMGTNQRKNRTILFFTSEAHFIQFVSWFMQSVNIVIKLIVPNNSPICQSWHVLWEYGYAYFGCRGTEKHNETMQNSLCTVINWCLLCSLHNSLWDVKKCQESKFSS